MKKLLLLITILIITQIAGAQKQANFWYFGRYAGLNFGLGIPVAMTNGQLTTGEGCSSISDANGSLVFYTDGRYVWNRNNVLMPNGSGLYGHSSSTQSGIIVPKPGSTTEYYIFTVDAIENNLAHGLCYSLVDMTLNGGLGDVVPSEKNVSLLPYSLEKVTAVGHSNGLSTWVITHQWNSNAYYAYLVTTSGVNMTPVITNIGDNITGNMEWAKGYIKVSPDGKTMAIAFNEKRSIDILDFNNSTGVLSNDLEDNNFQVYSSGGPYGVEFSPNGKLLYISEWKDGHKIFQYNLKAGSPQAILDSRVIVGTVGQNDDPIGAIQLAPDNRLYIARQNHDYLSRINSPNTIGVNCGFQADAMNLAGRQSTYGLPPFVQSFFFMNLDYYYDSPICYGNTTNFFTSAGDDPDAVLWDFGDIPSGINNTSTELNPSHDFTSSGIFLVKLKVFISIYTDSIYHLVLVNKRPQIDESGMTITDADFGINNGSITGITFTGTDSLSYTWFDESNTIISNSLDLTSVGTGNYTLLTEDANACDTLTGPYFIDQIGGPVGVSAFAEPGEICIGESVQLIAQAFGGVLPYTYTWTSDPSGFNSEIYNPLVMPTVTTKYHILIHDYYDGIIEDSVTVNVNQLPVANAGTDITVSNGTTASLSGSASGGSGNYSYSWQPSTYLNSEEGDDISGARLEFERRGLRCGHVGRPVGKVFIHI